jgi:orotate phosphoribosyltransferase
MLGLMDILSLYRSVGGYLEGHFLLASGRHAPAFLQSTTVLQHPEHAFMIGRGIAALFGNFDNFNNLARRPDFVIGPAMGGVILAFVVAKVLGCRALFAEKDGRGGMLVRKAFSIAAGERFVAVEDVVTTGGSLLKSIAAAEGAGASCLGVGLIIDRGEARFPQGLAVRSLARFDFVSYPAADCPLCRAGLPLEEV